MPLSSNDFVIAQSFGSGSSGNALLIRAAGKAILVDCGIGIRKLRSGLATHGLTPTDLDAVLVTHEHQDHIRTLPKIARDDLPIIATSGTARHAHLPVATTCLVAVRASLSIAGATVHALPVRHDASDPCGYHIEIGGARITVLTDLGSWEDHLLDAVASSDLVLLEANYNETMLARGPYPARLRRRVASAIGHLGNMACGEAMASALRAGAVQATWWLSHLSQTNNSPHQAELDVREVLNQADFHASVTALPRRDHGPVWTFEPSHRSLPNPTRIVTSRNGSAAQLGLPGLG